MQMKEDALSSNTVLAFDKEEWQKVGTLAIKVVTIKAVVLTSGTLFVLLTVGQSFGYMKAASFSFFNMKPNDP